jgi:hypothetical protein
MPAGFRQPGRPAAGGFAAGGAGNRLPYRTAITGATMYIGAGALVIILIIILLIILL